MTATSPATTEDAATRIANRYPQRGSKAPIVVISAVLFAALIGWMIWAGYDHATPGVSGQLHGYQVVSDTQVDVTLKVHRPDPSVAALCQVQAQAISGEPVGELTVAISPSTEKDVTKQVQIKTSLRATTAVLQNCRRV